MSDIYVQGILNNVSETESALCRTRLIEAVHKFVNKTRVKDIAITIALVETVSKSTLYIQGIPKDAPATAVEDLRSRLGFDINHFLNSSGLQDITFTISTTKLSDVEANASSDAAFTSVTERAKRYTATQPLFKFEHLVVPKQVEEDLLLAVDLIRLESKVFDEWGLRQIEPFPRTALNFYGNPGTGKTLAAHAIASKIESPILVASYAQIESMYHGEGPKNVEAIFLAAEQGKAVLFIDEADSLLSKRLTNVTQGSEQAINSMRSQLLICLERFKGIVIFSTNLVKNYDKAFETRIRHVQFPMPDEICRCEIWRRHLPVELPLALDVSCERLAKEEDVCGRDIKNVVIDAAMRVAREGKHQISLSDFLSSLERIKKARISVDEESSSGNDLSPTEQMEVGKQVQEAIDGRNNTQ